MNIFRWKFSSLVFDLTTSTFTMSYFHIDPSIFESSWVGEVTMKKIGQVFSSSNSKSLTLCYEKIIRTFFRLSASRSALRWLSLSLCCRRALSRCNWVNSVSFANRLFRSASMSRDADSNFVVDALNSARRVLKPRRYKRVWKLWANGYITHSLLLSSFISNLSRYKLLKALTKAPRIPLLGESYNFRENHH